MKKYIQKKWNKLLAHKELKKLIINMNWLFIDTMIRMGVTFFVGILVIRYLGPEQYGLLGYANAIVAFFIVFSKLGLDVIIVREFVIGKFEEKKILGTVFYLKLCGGALAVILATLTAHFLKGDIFITIMTATVSFTFMFQSTDVIDLWFQSKVVSKYVAYSRSTATIICAIIKFSFVTIHASLFWFVFVLLAESIFVAIGLVVAYFKNRESTMRWAFDYDVAKSLLKDSCPLILSSFSIMIYMRIDQIMIGNMLDFDALGNYSVAVNLSEMWYFIPVIIATSVFPAIIVIKKRSETEYNKRLQQLYDMMIWLAIAIAVPITFLGDWIINFLYGGQYTQASGALTIYIWAGIFVFLGTASGKWLINENLQIFYSINTTIGAGINIILNYFLIQKIGINGAAWATLISYAFSAYILLSIHKKTRINFHNLSKSLFFITTLERYYKLRK